MCPSGCKTSCLLMWVSSIEIWLVMVASEVTNACVVAVATSPGSPVSP